MLQKQRPWLLSKAYWLEMDNFRWILLAVGIFIIVIVYMISRKNKRDFYQEDDYSSEDLPEINTRNWDELDEGVGEVRIVARSNDDVRLESEKHPAEVQGFEAQAEYAADDKAHAEDEYDPLFKTAVPQPEPEPEPEPETEPIHEPEPEREAETEADAELEETVLVLNILARDGSSLQGSSINSVALANNMEFGDMNIYHRMDNSNGSVFSLVNMVKPGSFDPSTIDELETPGITLFLQLPGPFKASTALDDMLHTAQRMSEMLEARLCDRSRQPLTESVVEDYLNTAASFDDSN